MNFPSFMKFNVSFETTDFLILIMFPTLSHVISPQMIVLFSRVARDFHGMLKRCQFIWQSDSPLACRKKNYKLPCTSKCTT